VTVLVVVLDEGMALDDTKVLLELIELGVAEVWLCDEEAVTVLLVHGVAEEVLDTEVTEPVLDD
jgi:hypothetical protein